ncbi:MAG TPA: hypothetical protein VHO69_07195 [Phototrophicaceae bacterium]|nr:hypothetical protein [Phototrophicaceae bacterium]
MTEKTSKEKAKRGERRSRAAVDFIVPLQLEQCLYHINHQPRGEIPLRVMIEYDEDGGVHFIARLQKKFVLRVNFGGGKEPPLK